MYYKQLKTMENGLIYNGGNNENFSQKKFTLSVYSLPKYAELQYGRGGGVCFLRKVDFVNIVMRKL